MHLKSKLYDTSIIVMPVLMPDNHELPFMSLSDNEISDSFTPALTQCNDELTTILNNDKIDHTGFADIDPDTNYLIQNTLTDSNYFTETQFNKLRCSNDNFSLFNVNIRSTGAHFDNLRYYLDGLNHKFSVFSITESWLKDYNKDVYNLEGYEHICKIRKNRPGGGVSIYIKNSIKYDIKENLFIDVDGVDSISVEIPKEEFKTQKNIIVTSVYRPPNTNPKHFVSKVNNFLHQLHHENKHAFILGDYNINTIAAMVSPDNVVNDFQNTFLSYYFHPLITKPTRVFKNKSSLLDNIYTNFSNIAVSGILKTEFSDHYSLFCITKEAKKNDSKVSHIKREFTEKNISNFKKKLEGTDWSPIYDEDHLPKAFSIFQETFTTIFEDIFPLKEFLIKYKNRASYLTKGLKMSLKNKHILWDKYEKNPTTENKNVYTKFRNKLTGLMRKNERLHLENQLDLFQNEMGKSWKILRTVLCKNSKNKDSPKFNINNQEVIDCNRMATEFNTHFVETGPKLSEKIDSSVNPLKYVKCNKTHIKLPYISEDEISRTINSLKNASAGWDNIPTFVVKKVSKHIIRPLTDLINKSIEQGIFPDELKVAKVFPIYKSGDKKCISNYRPISVLSFFSKVFEKVMYNHLIDFIDENNILSKHQFGFRKNHSTNHAVIALVDKISTALDMGKVAIGCFIDLKKAFETVNHFILINKLRKYGIHGNILEWFISYLDNRKQYVFYNGSKSNDQYISCGVPQGSILGPLLFILYINDLSNISESLTSIFCRRYDSNC